MKGRKRKQSDKSSSPSGNNPSDSANNEDRNVPRIIKAILGSNASIYSLPDFICKYGPSLPGLTFQGNSEDCERIRQTWVSPSDNLTVKTNLRSVSCYEALPDLVDQIIWNLLQQCNKNNRNVLAQGYVLASEVNVTGKLRPCPSMRPGVLCKEVNDNISFLKTSSYAKRLHDLIGDDMMRVLLLHTRLFLPLEQSKGNYLLLSGPALQPWRKKGSSRTRKWQWDQNSVIPRYNLFYSSAFVPKIGLPSSHVFNRPGNVKFLVNSMFPSEKSGIGKRIHLQQILMCTNILRRHKKCDYSRLLNRHCPLPECCKNEYPPGVTLSQLALLHTPNHEVISFLRIILSTVFPVDFWGSTRNFKNLLNKVEVFVFLRRQEQFPNKTLMEGIKVKDVCWLWRPTNGKPTKSDHEVATYRVRFIMRWVFCHFLIPLIRSNFYVTETEFSAKLTLYYRKPVWSMFRSMSMTKLLDNQYMEITKKEAIGRIRSQNMGFSRLRLLPKQCGVRPVAMLQQRVFLDFEDTSWKDHAGELQGDSSMTRPRKKRKSKDTKFQSTNFVLDSAFEVLRYERSRKPQIFGAGIYGLNELKPLLKDFLAKVRIDGPLSGKKTLADETQLYFASVDIHHCYDNIRQNHLLSILPSLFSHSHYLIQKHAVLHPVASLGRISKKKIHDVGPLQSYVRFHDAAMDFSTKYDQSIFVGAGGCTMVEKGELLNSLEEHLLSHMVLIDGRYGSRLLVQRRGIAQGSIVSSLLCNFYYCDMEKRLLANTGLLNENGVVQRSDRHLLVRIVDDFLLISTDPVISHNFVQRMWNGDSEFGVCINKAKTLTSFSALLVNSGGGEELLENGTVKLESGINVFPWCGLLFDTSTGEVGIDYSRFANQKAIDGLTIDRTGKEGKLFEIRMKSFVRPRCQALLFDPQINGPEMIRINFYQMMLLSAIKTGEYLRKGLRGGVRKNPHFVVRCIDALVSYAHSLITARLGTERIERMGFLGKQECDFLSLDAFHHVFHTMMVSDTDFNCTIVLGLLRQRILTSSLKDCDLSDLISRSRNQFDLANLTNVIT